MGLTRPKSSAGLVLGRHSAPDPHPRGTPARHHGGARATSPTRPGGRHHRRQYYRKHIDEPPSSARTSISEGTSIAGHRTTRVLNPLHRSDAGPGRDGVGRWKVTTFLSDASR